MVIACVKTFATAFAAIALVQSSSAPLQQLEPVTDPDSYEIYAALLAPGWAIHSKELLLLQQETVTFPPCPLSGSAPDAEWRVIEKNFVAENARVRVLRPMLPVAIPYRLVPHAAILADDAQLELKYPRILHRPVAMEYAAVSAVGFNETKTKAMVYVRFRDQGGIELMELRDGKWISARLGGCAWIA